MHMHMVGVGMHMHMVGVGMHMHSGQACTCLVAEVELGVVSLEHAISDAPARLHLWILVRLLCIGVVERQRMVPLRRALRRLQVKP